MTIVKYFFPKISVTIEKKFETIFKSSEIVTTVKYFFFQKLSVTIVEQFWEFSEFSKTSEMCLWLKCDYSHTICSKCDCSHTIFLVFKKLLTTNK